MSITQPTLAKPWTESLLQTLQQQSAMADQLASLASRQRELISAGNSESLLNLLAQRQAIIDEFTASQAELGKLTSGLDDRLNSMETVERNRIRALIERIGDRLNQVMMSDAEDQASLRSAQGAMKRELSAIGATRHARSAYRSPVENKTRFADRHG